MTKRRLCAGKSRGGEPQHMITAAEYAGPTFLTCSGAAKVLGLAESTLRRWCSAGMVPHIKSGTVYYINMPLLLGLLGRESRRSCAALDIVDCLVMEHVAL